MKHTIVTNESICISHWTSDAITMIMAFSHLNKVTTWTRTIFDFSTLRFVTTLSCVFQPFNVNRFFIHCKFTTNFLSSFSFRLLGYSSMRLRHHLMTNGLNRMGIVNFIMSFDFAFCQCQRLLIAIYISHFPFFSRINKTNNNKIPKQWLFVHVEQSNRENTKPSPSIGPDTTSKTKSKTFWCKINFRIYFFFFLFRFMWSEMNEKRKKNFTTKLYIWHQPHFHSNVPINLFIMICSTFWSIFWYGSSNKTFA